MNLPRIDLVIFDCDGVLVDSEVISAEVLVDVLAEDGFAIDTSYVFRNFTGKSFPKVAGLIAEEFGRPVGEGFEARYRAALFDAYQTRLIPTHGVADVLKRLKRPKCVATSSTPARLNRTLSLTGLDRFFGNDLFTASQVANGKPAPDLLLLAARTMQAQPRHCLVIEDTEVGLAAARAAGMTGWFYRGGAHLPRGGAHLPAALSGTPAFDNWDEFYQMAPELGR